MWEMAFAARDCRLNLGELLKPVPKFKPGPRSLFGFGCDHSPDNPCRGLPGVRLMSCNGSLCINRGARPGYAAHRARSLVEEPHCFSIRLMPRLRAGSGAYPG